MSNFIKNKHLYNISLFLQHNFNYNQKSKKYNYSFWEILAMSQIWSVIIL